MVLFVRASSITLPCEDLSDWQRNVSSSSSENFSIPWSQIATEKTVKKLSRDVICKLSAVNSFVIYADHRTQSVHRNDSLNYSSHDSQSKNWYELLKTLSLKQFSFPRFLSRRTQQNIFRRKLVKDNWEFQQATNQSTAASHKTFNASPLSLIFSVHWVTRLRHSDLN